MASGEGFVLPRYTVDGSGNCNCDESGYVDVDYVEKCLKNRYVRVCFYFSFDVLVL